MGAGANDDSVHFTRKSVVVGARLSSPAFDLGFVDDSALAGLAFGSSSVGG